MLPPPLPPKHTNTPTRTHAHAPYLRDMCFIECIVLFTNLRTSLMDLKHDHHLFSLPQTLTDLLKTYVTQAHTDSFAPSSLFVSVETAACCSVLLEGRRIVLRQDGARACACFGIHRLLIFLNMSFNNTNQHCTLSTVYLYTSNDSNNIKSIISLNTIRCLMLRKTKHLVDLYVT